jgi:hypothetical protein
MRSTVSPYASTGHLLNNMKKALQVKNDRALAEKCRISTALISKLRGGKLPVGATLLLRFHDVSDIPIDAMRLMAGLLPYTEVGQAKFLQSIANT